MSIARPELIRRFAYTYGTERRGGREREIEAASRGAWRGKTWSGNESESRRIASNAVCHGYREDRTWVWSEAGCFNVPVIR